MNNSTDGAVNAPVSPRPERQGRSSAPITARYPQIRGGVCEFCGILDQNVPSEHQYRLCPHFRAMGDMYCTYCAETKNPDEVVRNSNLNVAGHPENPSKLVVWCDSFECSSKHLNRFKMNR